MMDKCIILLTERPTTPEGVVDGADSWYPYLKQKLALSASSLIKHHNYDSSQQSAWKSVTNGRRDRSISM